MLSAKYARKHGMRNEKWNTRDKMSQFRAILKLQARDKKLQAENGLKIKRKTNRNLKELTNETQEYRGILKDVIYGNKILLRTVLQAEKDFQIFLQDAEPVKAFRAIFQDFNLKRKQLDKLLYLKVKKRDKICKLKSEYSELNDQLEHADEITETESQQLKRQQQLITRYQMALAKRHAANSISDAYREILEVLKKDSMYFDGVLATLREDQRDQCQVIYKTTLMGQLATEDLDDVRQRYRTIEKDVWVNMKEREKSLESARAKAQDVWEYAKSLVRTESDTNLVKKADDNAIDKNLEEQIHRLEQIFDTMKETMLIRSYEELFSRLEDQVKQRERLTRLYKNNLKERNFVLNKKKHAELLLQNLEHSMVSTTTKYKVEKKSMLEKIQKEKEREMEKRNLIKSRGELLIKIKTALQNMASMLICVDEDKMNVKEKDTKKAVEEAQEKTEVDKEPEKEKGTCDDSVETEGLAVLIQVSQKAAALFAQTNFKLTTAKEEKAKDMYATYISNYYSNLKFEEEKEQTGMYFEHEAVDSIVPTRAEIKMNSRKIVEAHTEED